jgi:hypothetical protein
LKAGELRELPMTLSKLKGNLVILGGEGGMRLRVDNEDRGELGSGIVRDLGAGEHRVELGSEGLYWSASVTIKGEETSRVEAKPWPVGWIEFGGALVGATFRLEAQSEATGPALGQARNIRAGKDRLILSAPGYKEKTVEVNIVAGKAARVNAALEARSPASLVLPPLDTEVELVVDGKPMKGAKDSAGRLRFEGVPTGRPVKIGFRVPVAEASGIPERSLELKEGENLALELPTGRFSLPTLAGGGSVNIGGWVLPAGTDPTFVSPLLPVGAYRVEVTGAHPFSGSVDIEAGTTVEVKGYRTTLLASLASAKVQSQLSLKYKRNRTTVGLVSLGTGLLGAAGSAAAYVLGVEAGRAYDAALDSATAREARGRVELYGSLFPIGAALGGLGLGLSPLLLLGGPDPAALQRSIEELDRQIEALEK